MRVSWLFFLAYSFRPFPNNILTKIQKYKILQRTMYSILDLTYLHFRNTSVKIKNKNWFTNLEHQMIMCKNVHINSDTSFHSLFIMNILLKDIVALTPLAFGAEKLHLAIFGENCFQVDFVSQHFSVLSEFFFIYYQKSLGR